MYPASLIAYIFVKKGIVEACYLTQMKLQKMVYFANGYHLARFGTPLVEEDIEAWKFGPVIPGIYNDYKTYGSGPIMNLSFYDEEKLKKISAEVNDLDPQAKEAIEYTWEATKNVSARALSGWTHLPDSPWDKSYQAPGYNKVIDRNDIKTYFEDFLAQHQQ